MHDDNPYEAPYGVDSSSVTDRDRRWGFLLLPPLIPLIVHGVARVFISPGGRTPYLAFMTLGAIIPAWMWAHFMVDRLQLSFWKTYAVTCVIWGAVFGVALTSSFMVNWLVGSP